MHQFLANLQDVCDQALFRKKILIAPSYLDGNTFQKNLTLSGFSALNLYISTLFDVAREMCSPILLKKECQILDSTSGQILILEILKDLSLQDKLIYFKLPLISPSLARTIFRTIKEIRVSGFSTHKLPKSLLPASPKMQDLLLVMAHYEQELKKRKLIDEAGLYHWAEQVPPEESEVVFLVPANLPMNETELHFFNKKIRHRAVILEINCPEVKIAPNNYPLAASQKTALLGKEGIFDLRYQEENANFSEYQDLNLEFYQVYGEYNETKEVLRKIIKEGCALDEVQVFYTTQEPYSQYFYQLAQLYGIPITFHSGINIKNSHPAQFLFSLLDWINDNYSINRLVELLVYTSLVPELENTRTLHKITSLLRQSPIGWGRERYIPGIELAIAETKKRMENIPEEKEEELSREIEYLQVFREWVNEIFSEIPEHKFGQPVSLTELAGGLIRVLNEYALIEDSASDKEAALIISQKLAVLEQNTSLRLPMDEALLLIRNIITEERINCSAPLPGHLHIASYKKGIWLNRNYTFLVGMDYQKFPGSSGDDTVLLEFERGPFKQLLGNRERDKLEELRMLGLIFLQKGKIFLSYSCFDTVKQAEQAPANLMLCLYRLQSRNPNLNYQAFYRGLSPIKEFIPQNSADILDSGELYLHAAHKKQRDLRYLFNQQYGAFREGMKAHETRTEKGFNVYNGKIEVKGSIVDPRENRGIVLSASKLERIAYCPYLYFLVDILKVKPMEEMVYDPTMWLSPLERGSFLHDIYEKFYKTLLKYSSDKKVIPVFNKHWQLLEEIIEESLAEKRKYLAPPGELVYEAEKRDILDSGRIFLAEEEKNFQGQFPQYFELNFGTRENEHEVLGKVKAVELTLSNKRRVSVQGKIDRVDLLPDGTYRIIDYKTGSSKDFNDSNPFRNGQQIQHGLYAIALEKILTRKGKNYQAKVSESGYYFPTVSGLGKLVLYKEPAREQVLEIIELLLNIVAKGSFAMTQKPDEYMCLDYKDILEQNKIIVLKGDKGKEYLSEPALEEMRRLQHFV
ncbi:MAG: hypothetical protein GX240_03065 [Candidatus Atribacteria bacterium]|jgi:ATP-dependent helicase/nuclease subunit B|nr:hypothetical protein [Candidatus Atribacteria bacterium]